MIFIWPAIRPLTQIKNCNECYVDKRFFFVCNFLVSSCSLLEETQWLHYACVCVCVCEQMRSLEQWSSSTSSVDLPINLSTLICTYPSFKYPRWWHLQYHIVASAAVAFLHRQQLCQLDYCCSTQFNVENVKTYNTAHIFSKCLAYLHTTIVTFHFIVLFHIYYHNLDQLQPSSDLPLTR